MRLDLIAASARHPAAQPGTAPALQPLTLAISPGEQVAVIGPSGAGKTTLLHLAAAALRPAGGTVSLDSTDPWAVGARPLRALRSRLFLAPQVPPLPPRQRVVTAVLAGALPAWSLWTSLRSLAYPVDIPAAHAALDAFDLGDKLFDRVDRLSGGERQRVGLARALLSPASLWLVDEPLSALDPTRAALAIDTLTREARQRRVTLVATLHQVDVALRRFERVIGLRGGALAFDLPAGDVTPAHLARLYAQFEHELTGGPPLPVPDTLAPPPVVVAPMHCR